MFYEARGRRRLPAMVVALLAAALIGAGCGSDDDDSSTTAEELDHVRIDPRPRALSTRANSSCARTRAIRPWKVWTRTATTSASISTLPRPWLRVGASRPRSRTSLSPESCRRWTAAAVTSLGRGSSSIPSGPRPSAPFRSRRRPR